jgi:hypothetical protein
MSKIYIGVKTKSIRKLAHSKSNRSLSSIIDEADRDQNGADYRIRSRTSPILTSFGPRSYDHDLITRLPHSLVGVTLILARAVNDENLSERILHTTAKPVRQQTNVRGPVRRPKGMR